MVKNGLKYLQDFVDAKRGMYEPSGNAKKGQKSVLMLTYYRNNMSHFFIHEAMIASSLLGFSSLSNGNKITID